MKDFQQTSIRVLREMLQKGERSPQELYAQAKAVIDAKNDTLNVFIETFPYETLSVRDEGKDTPLYGIPFAMKDNILIKGKKVSAASHILENYHATYDAKVSELLREAGAIAMGRANMDEMAMGTSTENSFYGPTKNPIDTTRVPGGSSGGSAAAVAAGMVPFALGSDTGGSVRQPAALCGVVGLKPSYGTVSRRGLIAMASSLDVIGPIAQTVEDVETVYQVIAGEDTLDATFVPYAERIPFQEKNENKKRIGVPQAFLAMEGIQDEVRENFFQSIAKMEKAGYEIVDIDIPSLQYALAVYYIIQPAEVSSNMARFDGIRYGLSLQGGSVHDAYAQTRSEGFGDEVKRRIMLGTYVLSSGYHDAYYYKAQQVREVLTREIRAIFEKVDVIATPTAPSVAFRFGEKKDPLSLYLEDIFTVPYNLTGNPAISVPSGVNEEGLPFAMHFSAPLYCEDKLFAVAKDFEQVRDGE